MGKKLLLYWIFVLTGAAQFGQKINEAYTLDIRKTTSPVQVDGAMNEPAWQTAGKACNFWMMTPMDTSKASVLTEVRMTYDDDHLYIIAICHHEDSTPYRVESLRRDFTFGKNDNFIFFLDTFDDRTSGFTFGANAAGAQWDGMLYEGGKADLSWDNKWTSVVKNYPDKYIFEASIPFKSIRYKKGITRWGINFSRLDITKAEKSSWTPVPRQFPSAALAYTGTLVWDAPPPATGPNISIIPYALARSSKDYAAKTPADNQLDIGGDAKIALSSSLNLDLTVNPDFSQVEVDRQVTNLERFELFFPERRQFFLENADLFGNFGYANIRPFFSRRIGLGVPIQFGARLSGKLSKDWRMGVMDMQTKKVEETGLPAYNYSILSLQRKVFSRSNIGIMLINKTAVNYHPEKDTTQPLYSDYNRTAGVEYNLASSNNVWTGKAMLIKSFSPGKTSHTWVHAAHLQYNSRRWLLAWQQEYVGKNFNAEVGYVPRQGYIKLNPSASRNFFPNKGKILTHGPRFGATLFFDESMKQTDNEVYLMYSLGWRNQTSFSAWAAHNYVELLAPFDPTNSGKDTLARGTKHYWNSWGTEFVSKPQNLFTFGFSSRYGGYYANGTRLFLNVDLGYRIQPYLNIAASTSYNQIDMPLPWGRTTFWLVGPRIDLTLSNKVFFTTFVQYNEQQNNVNLNARFQWRYKPASDLYIVYTDNYFPVPLSIRNRAVVLKFTYWWNI